MSGLDTLEIRHLRALRAVAEEGTFALAGERLGYTQSAISQQIGALENTAGGAVFDRPGGPRRAVLTPLGQRLLDHGEAILQRVEAAQSDVTRFLAGEVGSLAVGTFQSASVRMLPSVLRQLRSDRPDLEVELRETTEEQDLIDWLLARSVDVAFLTAEPHDERIEVIPLLIDSFVVVSAADRRGDLGGDVVDPAQLTGQPLVCETASACQRLIEDGLTPYVDRLNVVFRTQDNAAVQAMVRSGVGHAVMASLAVDHDDPGVAIRALNPAIPARHICVGLRAGREQAPGLERFVELARNVASELVAASPWLAAAK